MKKLLILFIVSIYSLQAFACCYHSRNKAHEAKIQLASAYIAQQSFYSDFGFFHGCLKYMGYDPSREKENRFYALGFKHIEIHPKFLENLREKLTPEEFNQLETECFRNPVKFFPNGKGPEVTLEDFPEDAKVTIDENGHTSFKVYAIAKLVEDPDYKYVGPVVFSVDQDKNFDFNFERVAIERPFWETVNWNRLFGLFLSCLIFLFVVNIIAYLFLRKRKPRGGVFLVIEAIIVILVGIIVIKLTSICPRPEDLIIFPTLIICEILILFRRQKMAWKNQDVSLD